MEAMPQVYFPTLYESHLNWAFDDRVILQSIIKINIPIDSLSDRFNELNKYCFCFISRVCELVFVFWSLALWVVLALANESVELAVLRCFFF